MALVTSCVFVLVGIINVPVDVGIYSKRIFNSCAHTTEFLDFNMACPCI